MKYCEESKNINLDPRAFLLENGHPSHLLILSPEASEFILLEVLGYLIAISRCFTPAT